MFKTVPAFVRTLSVLILTVACTFGSEAETVATKSAQKWLSSVDAGKYAESWDAASQVFKNAITKPAWIEALGKVREQVGKFESRQQAAAQTVTDPPNAPPGEYVILQYTSDFANKREATETVVMSVDNDKQWRTSGYFVK